MEIGIGAGVFFLTLLVIYGVYFAVKKGNGPELKKVHRRLKTLSMSWQRNPTDILKKKTLSEIPWLNRMLLKLAFISRLKRFLDQAGTTYPLGAFVLLSALILSAALLAAVLLRMSLLAMALPSALLATAPFLYLSYKRKKRMEKFERQLPDALELIARSLKAGHAFTGGLRLVAEEFGDPVGTELGRTLDEINFGAGVPEALTNLIQRTDCEDLRFFVVSVIIQRETGGNLAEILENLGRLIKERFKFQGRVRALSAEGRLSGVILVAIPFCVAGFFSVFRPEYIGILFSDVIGKTLVLIALVMMGLGIYVISKMVAIKV